MTLGFFYNYSQKSIMILLVSIFYIFALSKIALAFGVFIFFVLMFIGFVIIVYADMFRYPNIALTNKKYHITTFFNRKGITYDISEFDSISKEYIKRK